MSDSLAVPAVSLVRGLAPAGMGRIAASDFPWISLTSAMLKQWLAGLGVWQLLAQDYRSGRKYAVAPTALEMDVFPDAGRKRSPANLAGKWATASMKISLDVSRPSTACSIHVS